MFITAWLGATTAAIVLAMANPARKRGWYAALAAAVLITMFPGECGGGAGLLPSGADPSSADTVRCETLFGAQIPTLAGDSQLTFLAACTSIIAAAWFAHFIAHRRLHRTTNG